MTDLDEARKQLHTDLGYRRPSPLWAKLEIVLGLFAVAVSISWMVHEVVHGEAWMKTGRYPGLGIVLFVLGGYLTLAGHRSHLYQSANDRTAYLLDQIRRLKKESHNT